MSILDILEERAKAHKMVIFSDAEWQELDKMCAEGARLLSIPAGHQKWAAPAWDVESVVNAVREASNERVTKRLTA